MLLLMDGNVVTNFPDFVSLLLDQGLTRLKFLELSDTEVGSSALRHLSGKI